MRYGQSPTVFSGNLQEGSLTACLLTRLLTSLKILPSELRWGDSIENLKTVVCLPTLSISSDYFAHFYKFYVLPQFK